MQFEWIADADQRLATPIIGFVSYFRLNNDFSSTLFMSIAELTAHAQKYSKTYSQATSKWKTDFNAMASKTVTKLNLDKNAPLSIDDKNFEALRLAVKADQAVKSGIDSEFEYVDNDENVSFGEYAEAEIVSPETKSKKALDATIDKIGGSVKDSE